MMATGGDDRLSELPDDLLLRVLRFTSLKEATSTTRLSRRWRAPLWLSSGAVNLDTGVRSHYDHSLHDTFVSTAVAALDAANVPVTRLTLRLEFDLDERPVCDIPDRYRYFMSRNTSLVDLVLSHQAARGVEELCLAARGNSSSYTVAVDSLPLETLQVLELYNCTGLYNRQATSIVLPRMSSLCLTYGHQNLGSLQRFIDAAPVLTAVRLNSVHIYPTPLCPNEAPKRGLRCPAATVLVLDNYWWEEKTFDGMEIDTPRLRRFRYRGILRSFSFGPQPLELEQVDLHFFRNVNNADLATFWRFVGSFTSTKQMRLRVNHLEDIALLNEACRVELLPAFRRLKRLEVEGMHWTKDKTAAATTILNLLRCCPMLRTLRINLTVVQEEHQDASNEKGAHTRIPQKEIQIDALLGPCHILECLKNSLWEVALQFRVEKWNCFGVKLIEFFAKNAMVLKEMHINGGDEKLCDHMTHQTEKWNSKRRKSGATCFVVLPLKR